MALIDQIRGMIFARRLEGRPLVTLSYAQSLDGCISARRGQPLALSGSESLHLTHQLRAIHDGILAGVGTILADDPQLDVRLVEGLNPQPIVLDSALRTPPGIRLLEVHRPSLWIFTTQRAEATRQKTLERAGARVFRVPENRAGRVDLNHLVRALYDHGIKHLMVEGGAQVITGFLKSQLVDVVVLTIAPVFVGGLGAVERISRSGSELRVNTGPTFSNGFPHLRDFQTEQLGEDLIIWGKPQWKEL